MLKSITHPRPADAFDLYRSLAWLARCEAVSKVKVGLREGTVIAFPRLAAVGGTGELAETGGSEGGGGDAR